MTFSSTSSLLSVCYNRSSHLLWKKHFLCYSPSFKTHFNISQKMKKILYITIESKSRELYPKLFLVNSAIRKNFDCFVGDKVAISRAVKILGPGIYFYKSINHFISFVITQSLVIVGNLLKWVNYFLKFLRHFPIN